MALDGKGGQQEIIQAPREAYKTAAEVEEEKEDKDKEKQPALQSPQVTQGISPAQTVTVTVQPGDTNASIAQEMGVSEAIARNYIPTVPRVGTQITVPVTQAPIPSLASPQIARGTTPERPILTSAQVAAGAYGAAPAPYSSASSAAKVAEMIPAPVTSGRELAAARERTSGALKSSSAAAAFGTAVLTPGEAGAGTQWSRYGVSTVVNRGPNVTTQEALAQTSRDVLSYLENFGRPSWIGSDVKFSLGLSDAQMAAMGYVLAPDTKWYRIEYAEPAAPAAASGYGSSYGYGGGYGGGGYGGAGYSERAELISWRIGL